jgi:hypothetical protein
MPDLRARCRDTAHRRSTRGSATLQQLLTCCVITICAVHVYVSVLVRAQIQALLVAAEILIAACVEVVAAAATASLACRCKAPIQELIEIHLLDLLLRWLVGCVVR